MLKEPGLHSLESFAFSYLFSSALKLFNGSWKLKHKYVERSRGVTLQLPTQTRGDFWNYLSCEQVTSLQSQLTSLRESSERQSKRAEDLNNKLKQVTLLSRTTHFIHSFISRWSEVCMSESNRLLSVSHALSFFNGGILANDEVGSYSSQRHYLDQMTQNICDKYYYVQSGPVRSCYLKNMHRLICSVYS